MHDFRPFHDEHASSVELRDSGGVTRNFASVGDIAPSADFAQRTLIGQFSKKLSKVIFCNALTTKANPGGVAAQEVMAA